jgi:hypothetical protein
MLREQGWGGFEYENNFKKNNKETIENINQVRKHWSKSTSTVGILQLIIDANINQFIL